MAIRRKVRRQRGARERDGPGPKVSLPTKRSKPAARLGDFSILMYGEKKIGKTTLAAEFPDAFFLMCEPGGRDLAIYQRAVPDWRAFRRYVQLISRDERFSTVVMDTADEAYKMCFDCMCKEMHIEHPHDESDYGKSWGRIRDEFAKQIRILLNSGKGVIFISHSREEETKTRAGRKYNRMQTTLSGQAREILEAIVDIWVYYGYEAERRVLTLRGDEYVSAGIRVRNHFKYTDGTQIRKLDVEGSEGHAYKEFLRAFNNEIQKPTGAKKRRNTSRRKRNASRAKRR